MLSEMLKELLLLRPFKGSGERKRAIGKGGVNSDKLTSFLYSPKEMNHRTFAF